MKELKKLSLKEEVDKEAKRIEKEVKSRQDLDDITAVSYTHLDVYKRQ